MRLIWLKVAFPSPAGASDGHLPGWQALPGGFGRGAGRRPERYINPARCTHPSDLSPKRMR
jgi:hypothetical protein